MSGTQTEVRHPIFIFFYSTIFLSTIIFLAYLDQSSMCRYCCYYGSGVFFCVCLLFKFQSFSHKPHGNKLGRNVILSRAPEFTPGFQWGSYCSIFSLLCSVQYIIVIPPFPEGGEGYTVLPLSVCPSVLPSVQDIFRRIFLSKR